MPFGIFTQQVQQRLRAAKKTGAPVDLFRVETRIPIDTSKDCPKPDYPGVVILKANGNLRLQPAGGGKPIEMPIDAIGGIRIKVNKAPARLAPTPKKKRKQKLVELSA